GNLADALYQTGRTFYQETRFDEAINYFRRVAEQFPDSSSARDALNQMAASYARTKRYDEALATYRRIIERYTDQGVQERAYLNTIDVLRDAGRDQEALEWAKQTRSRFRGQAGALALFSQARIQVTRGAWAEALQDFEALLNESDLGGGRAAGGTNKTEVAFLRAYVMEQLGRTEDAVSAYLSITDGRNEYYGWRATVRLREMAKAERTRDALSSRLQSLRAEAQQVISSNDAERARNASQKALRLTEDETVRREMLDVARRAYAALPAYNRLPQFKLLPFGRQEVLQTGAAAPTKPTRRALADELLFLGLYDEGAPELAVADNVSDRSEATANSKPAERGEKAGQDSASSTEGAASSSKTATGRAPSGGRDALYTLAVLYKRGDAAHHAVRFAEPIWKTMPADYLLEFAPREMLELFYPVPYQA
ncbi:MAG: tetratricopeptide repeat protein, partial [Acidobacteria bacterium]|nr:tetratricopeptide repeat protein [Acidobacteriota bacterium]